MTKKWGTTAAFLVTVVSAAGFHLLTAQERPNYSVRATPKQIKDHIDSHPLLTAASVEPVGKTIQDLQILANDLDRAGQTAESKRLKNSIGEIIRRADLQLAEKRAQVARLTDDIEELRLAIGE